jgi:hypothetical protein
VKSEESKVRLRPIGSGRVREFNAAITAERNAQGKRDHLVARSA